MLNDLVAPNLKLVVCGTAAGKQSAVRQMYYAHPGNRFWRTLASVGLTPRQLRPEEYPQLISCGIGLTDIVKGQSGMDRDIAFHGNTAETVRSTITRL